MQTKDFRLISRTSSEYGGNSRRGFRKIKRPFQSRRPLHIVMRSKRARGEWSFLHRKHKHLISVLLKVLAKDCGLRIYKFENVGNHLQLLAKFPSRQALRKFLRVFTQRLVFLVTGARKGQPKGKFFDAIAYSRIVFGGREFQLTKKILSEATTDAFGFDRNTILRWRNLARNGASEDSAQVY